MSWIEDPGVTVSGGFNISDLSVDEAWMNISSDSLKPLWLYELSANCHLCPFSRKSASPILPGRHQIYKVDTQFPLRYRLRTEGLSKWVSLNESDLNIFCDIESIAGEFGVYSLQATDDKCTLTTELEPVNIILPITLLSIVCILLSFAGILWKAYATKVFKRVAELISRKTYQTIDTTSSEASGLGLNQDPTLGVTSSRKKISKRRRQHIPPLAAEGSSSDIHEVLRNEENAPINDAGSGIAGQLAVNSQHGQNPIESSNTRLRSLDVFRGISIIIMIFADDGGGKYYFFEHSTWNGLYVADLAFPWFLWIMGVCIPISIRSQRKRGATNWKIFKKICIRSVKLILLGIFMNTASSPRPVSLETLRVPGVLQRFGICYLTASALLLFLCNDKESDVDGQGVDPSQGQQPLSSGSSNFKDIRLLWIPWIIVLLILIAHFLITFLLPVPGCPMGYLGPGGLHMDKKYSPICIGGAAGYVDRIIFTENHIYQRPTAKRVYKSGPFDPEGSLGILTSLVQVWFGVQTGIILQTFSKPWARVKRLILWAVTSGSLGAFICGGLSNSGWIPINKNLWSFSYVLLTSSFSWTLLCFLYIIIDVKSWWSGSPFYEPGMNSILLYIGHNVARSMLPFNFAFGQMNTHFSHLLENLWGLFLWITFSIYLFKNKMFWIV